MANPACPAPPPTSQPKRSNLSKKSTRMGKGMEINDQNSNLGKLQHLMIHAILLENYLTISEISIQHVQIDILPILVPA